MKDEFNNLELYMKEYIDNMFSEYIEKKDFWYYYMDIGIIWVRETMQPFPESYDAWVYKRLLESYDSE